MLTPTYTRQFERDLKLMLKRGKDPEKVKLVMTTLINEELDYDGGRHRLEHLF